jgi:hypothetical protein
MGRWGGWVLGISVGCSGGGGPKGDTGSLVEGGCTSDDITIAPGTGAEAYVPLAAGDPVTLVHGPQGGWHIETAALVGHSEPEVSVDPRVTVPDLGGLEIVGEQEPSFIALVGYDEATCEGNFYNVRGFVDTEQGALSDQDFVCTLEGKALALDVTVADIATGRTSTAGVEVVGELDPADVAVCRNISVALGVGAGEAFEPLATGAEMVLVNDLAGGWYVEVAGRVRRSVEGVTVHPRVTVPSLGELQIVGADAPSSVTLAGYDPELGEGTFAGVRGSVDVDQGVPAQDFVCSLDGARLLVEVTVAEEGGDGLLTVGVEATAALDPADRALCGG